MTAPNAAKLNDDVQQFNVACNTSAQGSFGSPQDLLGTRQRIRHQFVTKTGAVLDYFGASKSWKSKGAKGF
jgi:hypothetical protein